MYIAIEGYDRSGKSTLFDRLIREFNVSYFKLPSTDIENFFNPPISFYRKQKEKYAHMMAMANQHVISGYRYGDKGNTVFLSDRSIYSNWAYNCVAEGIRDYPAYTSICVPDKVIFLDTPMNEIQSRWDVEQDGIFSEDHYNNVVGFYRELVLNQFCERHGRWYAISSDSEKQIYETVKHLLIWSGVDKL